MLYGMQKKAASGELKLRKATQILKGTQHFLDTV